jgi:hypothetical protein
MKILALGATLALSFGLGGCSHMGEGMHGMHDGMMGQHGARECPPPEQAQHGEGEAAHDHSETAPAVCPSATPPH